MPSYPDPELVEHLRIAHEFHWTDSHERANNVHKKLHDADPATAIQRAVAAGGTPQEVVAAAWDAWLNTEDHRFTCIGYSEGQSCCAEVPPDDHEEGDYGGHQRKLIDLALVALTKAGYLISSR